MLIGWVTSFLGVVVKLMPDAFIEKIGLAVVTVVVVELLAAFVGINDCCGRAPVVVFSLKTDDVLPNRPVCEAWLSWMLLFPNSEVDGC